MTTTFTNTPASLLANEQSIVWLEDIERLDYVRETIDSFCHFRQRQPGYDGPGRLVGYSTLTSSAQGSQGYFTRRIFWIAPHDRGEAADSCYANRGAPSEAVDPRTVATGQPGLMTERAWGAPLEENVRSTP